MERSSSLIKSGQKGSYYTYFGLHKGLSLKLPKGGFKDSVHTEFSPSYIGNLGPKTHTVFPPFLFLVRLALGWWPSHILGAKHP